MSFIEDNRVRDAALNSAPEQLFVDVVERQHGDGPLDAAVLRHMNPQHARSRR